MKSHSHRWKESKSQSPGAINATIVARRGDGTSMVLCCLHVPVTWSLFPNVTKRHEHSMTGRGTFVFQKFWFLEGVLTGEQHLNRWNWRKNYMNLANGETYPFLRRSFFSFIVLRRVIWGTAGQRHYLVLSWNSIRHIVQYDIWYDKHVF